MHTVKHISCPPIWYWRLSCISVGILVQNLLNAGSNLVVLAVGEEVLLKLSIGQGTLDQLTIQILQDGTDGPHGSPFSRSPGFSCCR